MFSNNANQADNKDVRSHFTQPGDSRSKPNFIDMPSITLPKGGGALKGIDEKFKVNAVNGTAAFSVPLPFASARGNSPSFNLSYNSGAGNSAFGIGWSTDLPSIKRKTNKQLPQYQDAMESDTFLLSNAEDLVPVFRKETDGSYSKDETGNYTINEKDDDSGEYRIRLYMPRIEGAFTRIERWMGKNSTTIKWRIITKDNITTLYGWTPQARITDPQQAAKIFEWLPEFSYDDKGNCTHYVYKKEDSAGFDPSLLHHRNRFANGAITYTNLYLEKVLYGNTTPYLNFNDPFPAAATYLFETIFDYGEYNPAAPYNKIKEWDFRTDAFSDFYAGFEIRTTRLCKRVMQFHRFNGDNEYNGLVRSCNFEYMQAEQAGINLLKSVTVYGYAKKEDGSYTYKSLPAVEFEYQQLEWDTTVKALSKEDWIHAPAGIDDVHYQLTDLFNEGLPGILTEQTGGWYYKHNLGEGHFEPARLVMPKPSYAGLGDQLQLADLEADGGKQLVSYYNGMAGYFELNDEGEWQPFKCFEQFPNVNLKDANLRLLDLNGDGRPEVLITEEQAFTWIESAGKEGFSQIHSTHRQTDEEAGPNIIFADAEQTVYLADMSGDGLTDIVRVRNGNVCYWPNLGYGRFGAKISMDNAPLFDHPEAFNPNYIRLADIDGSGTTDLIYLGKNRFSCWMNKCGNAFSSTPVEITAFPDINPQAKITVTDFLGNGIACIVWSGIQSKDANAPLRYIDLLNSKKPYMLLKGKNNMGKEVSLSYTASTRYYIEDKLAGKPWITKLHFPVHCVSGIEVIDTITGHRFVSSYKYHHGYYDHAEQEFRGFGLVEQIDTEHFEHWSKGNASNIVDEALHQPPVLTKSWFHTGAFAGSATINDQFAHEYWYEEITRQGYVVVNPELPMADTRLIDTNGVDLALNAGLSASEWREALRACKSSPLRVEVFALDAPLGGATEEQIKKQLTPYTVAAHNCVVELVQPKGQNQFAVFIVKESETINYHYERNTEDPRIAHNLNISLDAYGNILETVSVVYPRMIVQPDLPSDTQQAQAATTIRCTANQFTNDVMLDHQYRLRLPAETRTWELKGVHRNGGLYTIDDFKEVLDTAQEAAYHEWTMQPAPGIVQKRLIEHTRTNYYRNDLTGALPLYDLEYRAISFENYQLAYTPALLNDIYSGRVNETIMTEGKFTHSEGDDNWWVRSGSIQYITAAETAVNAQQRFFTPVSYTDAFGAVTKLRHYGNYYLFIDELEDVFGNKSTVTAFNFRTLAPRELKDINNNLSAVIHDELGLVKAMAVMGKGNEADALTGITEYTSDAETTLLTNFLAAADSVSLTAVAKQLLQRATTRFVYDLDVYKNSGQPVMTASIAREEHDRQNNQSPVQLSFEYSSGAGQVAMKKVQAEPGLAKQVIVHDDQTYTISTIDTAALDPVQLRWIGNGRTVLNNKGNAVKSYEPYFSVSHRYEELKELVETGVTPVMYYDAVGRLIRTVLPDGTLSRTEFDNWQQHIFDRNDTISEPACTWYHNRTNRLIDAQLIAEGKDPEKEKTAADKAFLHANTPTVLHVDTLGKPVLAIEHNKNVVTAADEYYQTIVQTDTEGNLRTVTDALDRRVVLYKYDMLGNKVYQQSMDGGQRWLFVNIPGKPVRTWDERNHQFQYFYDLLQRPIYSKVLGGDGDVPLDHLFEKIVYGEDALLPGRTNEAALQADNLLGKPAVHYDTAGMVATPAYDFKGKPLSVTRQLSNKYKETVNWIDAHLATDLEAESFTITTQTDALGRVTQQTAPDGSIIVPTYNATGLLNGESVIQGDPAVTVQYIKDIDYNEKGQRSKIIYGNDVITRYEYDTATFRLKRLTSKRQNNDPLQDWHYTYDAIGNITHIEDRNIPVVFFNNQKVTGVATYTYDALYRLTAATGRENDAALGFNSTDNWQDAAFVHELSPGDPMSVRNYMQSYRYDAAGNILEMWHTAAGNSWTRNYEYEALNNRLTATSVGQDTSLLSFAYQHHTAHGFMTVLPHLEELGWNCKEELVKTVRQRRTDGGTPETTWYQYDGQGQRIRKITENSADAGSVPVKKEERIYISGYELYKKYTGSFAGLQRHSVGLMDDKHRFLIIETRNGVDDGTEQQLVRYQLHNHLGSASLELDAAAQVISYEEYHPYGTTAYQARNSSIRAAAKRYRYTGMERDEESGLEYHNARYYLPWLGRWMNCDPIGIRDGLNVYRYVSNNPLIKTDASGTDEVTIYHRTTEDAAASMARSGARVDMNRPHVWAGGGFYGSSSSAIPSSSGTRGDVIVGQTISTDRIADLDEISRRSGIGHNITTALQDTAEGRAIRSQIYRQMYNQSSTLRRTMDRRPSSADIDDVFKDYIGRQLNLVAPNADVLRWSNPDGTFTYVVRNERALIGAPTVVGRMVGGRFVKGGGSVPSTPSTPPASGTPDTPQDSTPRSAAPDSPRAGTVLETAEEVGRAGRLGRTALRRSLMAVPVLDVITQQVTYEESAYTGDRGIDAVFNVTIAEIWEIPMAVYSVAELGAYGIVEGGRAVSEAVDSASQEIAEEYVAPWYAPLEREITNLYR